LEPRLVRLAHQELTAVLVVVAAAESAEASAERPAAVTETVPVGPKVFR
jgi:hypothetical protein